MCCIQSLTSQSGPRKPVIFANFVYYTYWSIYSTFIVCRKTAIFASVASLGREKFSFHPFLLLCLFYCGIWSFDLWSNVTKWGIRIVAKKIFFKNCYCYSITVVCIFSPSLHPTPANPTSLPHLHPRPWFCPCVLYSSSCKPLSPLSPLAIVTMFLISMSSMCGCLLWAPCQGTWPSTQACTLTGNIFNKICFKKLFSQLLR